MKSLLVILFCCFFSVVYPHNFDPQSVRLLDSQGDTYLFRGNLPIMNSDDKTHAKFAYQELISTFEKILGHPLPQGVELYDVCLLSPIVEGKEIQIEKAFFEQNPGLGVFINHPIYGCVSDPMHLTSGEIAFALHHLPVLSDLKPLIHTLHHDYMQSGKSRVIYVHCFSGHDRTGEVSGSYSMHYKGDSFETVKAVNTQIAHREISGHSENAMEWYGYYLKDIRKIDVGPIK